MTRRLEPADECVECVAAAGGYVGAEPRALREVFRSMERSGHIRVDGDAAA